jgi:two-component system, chemotaxis family, response regulator Rcp1
MLFNVQIIARPRDRTVLGLDLQAHYVESRGCKGRPCCFVFGPNVEPSARQPTARQQALAWSVVVDLPLRDRWRGMKKIMHKMIGAAGMPIDVLLVEDSLGDVRLTRESFRDANSHIQLHVVNDGLEAMAFLRRSGAHAGAPRPDLILLDLNLPKMDGREVLAHIKADVALRAIPTVILTTSDAEADIAKSYELHANCYLNKPVQLEAFDSLVKSINDFWLTRVKLPQQKLHA